MFAAIAHRGAKTPRTCNFQRNTNLWTTKCCRSIATSAAPRVVAPTRLLVQSNKLLAPKTLEAATDPTKAFRNTRNFIYFPNFPINIRRAGVSDKKGTIYKEVEFDVPLNLGKKDIEAYLTQVYGMDVVKINTSVYSKRFKRNPKGGRKVRRHSYKKAFVTIHDPVFQLPSLSVTASKDQDKKQ